MEPPYGYVVTMVVFQMLNLEPGSDEARRPGLDGPGRRVPRVSLVRWYAAH